MGMLDELRRDAGRLEAHRTSVQDIARLAVTNAAFSSIFIHRISRMLFLRGHDGLARLVGRVNISLHGIDIHPGASIGPGVLLQHPVGVVIGSATVGPGATFMGGVTLGRRDVLHGPDEGMYPTIGEGALLGAQSTVLGPVRVGRGASVGAGAVVLDDVPDGAVAVGAPARVVGSTPL